MSNILTKDTRFNLDQRRQKSQLIQRNPEFSIAISDRDLEKITEPEEMITNEASGTVIDRPPELNLLNNSQMLFHSEETYRMKIMKLINKMRMRLLFDTFKLKTSEDH